MADGMHDLSDVPLDRLYERLAGSNSTGSQAVFVELQRRQTLAAIETAKETARAADATARAADATARSAKYLLRSSIALAVIGAISAAAAAGQFRLMIGR